MSGSTPAAPAGGAEAQCSCCGQPVGERHLVALHCRADVRVCRECSLWLVRRHEDAAPGQLLREIAPVFLTTDLQAALDRYRRLGFSADAYEDVYGFAARDAVSFHLARIDAIDVTSTTCAAYLYVADADALHAEWRDAEVEGTLHEPVDTEYGLREGAYVDPDGNLIRFGSPLGEEGA